MNLRRGKQVIGVGLGALVVIGLVGWSLWRGLPPGQASTATIQNVPYDVYVSTEPRQVQAGETATVRMRVEQDGAPVDLDETGRLLHVIIVSADVGDAYHTFGPVQVAPGVFELDHTFTRAGAYRIWTEIDNVAAPVRHDEHAEQVAYAEMTVAGTAGEAVPETVTEIVKEGYRIQLEASSFVAGAAARLRVRVTDQAGRSVPLEVHEPFLYAISGENFSFFRHGHGGTLADGSAGLDNTFPVAGRYVIWMDLFVEEGDSYRWIPVAFIVKVD